MQKVILKFTEGRWKDLPPHPPPGGSFQLGTAADVPEHGMKSQRRFF